MAWELTLDRQIAFNVGYGASKPMRGAEVDEVEAAHVGCEYGENDEPAPQEIGLSFEAGLEPGR